MVEGFEDEVEDWDADGGLGGLVVVVVVASGRRDTHVNSQV